MKNIDIVIGGSICILLATFVGGAFKYYVSKMIKKFDNYIESAKQRMEANNEGTRTILLMYLTEYYEFAKINGFTDVEHKRKAQEVYNAYHNMGGNGLGTEMFNFIVKSPIKRKED